MLDSLNTESSIEDVYSVKIAVFDGQETVFDASETQKIRLETYINESFMRSKDNESVLEEFLSLDVEEQNPFIFIGKEKIKLDRHNTAARQYSYETLYRRMKNAEPGSDLNKELTSLLQNQGFLEELKRTEQVSFTQYLDEYRYKQKTYYLIFPSTKESEAFFKEFYMKVFYNEQALRNYTFGYIHRLTSKLCCVNNHSLSFLNSLAFISKDHKLFSKNSSRLLGKISDFLEEARMEKYLYNFKAVVNRFANIKARSLLKLEQVFSDSLKKDLVFEIKNDKFELLKLFSKDDKLQSTKVFQAVLGKYSKTDKIFEDQTEQEFIGKSLDSYMFYVLKRQILSEITSTGFLNVDLILNDESYSQTLGDDKTSQTLKWIMGLFNKLVGFNEGIMHKHFTLMGMGFSFVDNLTVLTFDERIDDARKSSVRLFDILFKDKWAESMAECVLHIYKAVFGFNSSGEEFDLSRITDKMKETVDSIMKSLEEDFSPGMLQFEKFSEFLACGQKENYSKLDNNCQHFTNQALEVLLKNQTFYFSNLCLTTDTRFLRIYEPFMTLIDAQVYNQIDTGEIDMTYGPNPGSEKEFINLLRQYNRNHNNLYPLQVKEDFFEGETPIEVAEVSSMNEISDLQVNYVLSSHTVFRFYLLKQRLDCLKKIQYCRKLKEDASDELNNSLKEDEEAFIQKHSAELWRIYKGNLSFERKEEEYKRILCEQKEKYCNIYLITLQIDYMIRGISYDTRVNVENALEQFSKQKNNKGLLKYCCFMVDAK